MNADLLVHGASEIVVGPGDGPDPDGSSPAEHLDVREGAALAVVDGEVAEVGPTDGIVAAYPPENADRTIDATGRTVLPGFVDPHTHAVFAGDRSDEFAAKLRGKSYGELLEEGGGIHRTVRATRAASADRLRANLLSHLDTMLAHGTTTVEVKSGYGLDVETELRLLSVVREADRRHPVDVVPTFLGAHAVPDGKDEDEYVGEVIDEQLPAVADQGIAEFCDVFCEEGAFSVEGSRRVLAAGRDHGLAPKVHAEELSRLGGARLAADLNATSADHLLYANASDARAMADADVTAVFLPGTAFGLGESYADPAPFREAGGTVALATDFNPNCHSRSVSFATALACVGMGMAPAEALCAATAGAAEAVDRSERGRLTAGAPADFAVIDAPSAVHVPYTYGENLVDTVVKDGDVVHERGRGRIDPGDELEREDGSYRR